MRREISSPRAGKGGTEHIHPSSEPIREEELRMQKAEESVYLECSGTRKEVSVAITDKTRETERQIEREREGGQRSMFRS